MKNLLSIIEIGGYPDFSELYQKNGYEVFKINTMRKALSYLNKNSPNIIVAEFIFGPKYGSIISNVDSLLAKIASHFPETKLILFVDKMEVHHLDKLRQRYDDHIKIETLFYPIDKGLLETLIVV
jgi:hypothetical protein